MIQKLLAFATILVATSVSASALTIEYEYQGQEFFCPAGPRGCDGLGNVGAFEGSLTIREEFLPVRSIANGELTFFYDFLGDGGDIFGYTLEQDGETYSASITGGDRREGDVLVSGPSALNLYADDPAFRFFDFDGILDITLCCLVASSPSTYSLTFGPSRKITDWSADSGLQGGSNDFTSSPEGDEFASGARSTGPGEWEIVSRTGRPAVIPVPTGAPLLAFALAAFGLLGFRLRARG